MSLLVVFVASCVLIGHRVNFVTGSFFLRSQLAVSTARNSAFGTEIIIRGPKAEAIYVMERSDQAKKVENERKKIENPNRKIGSVPTADFDSIDDRLNDLDQKAKENKFCSEAMLGDICQRAMKNSYFLKNRWSLEAGPKPECSSQEIYAKKDNKSFEYKRQLVKCNIKNQKGGRAFLEASTRYESGNLKYFVISEESDILKPIAFLMNKPEPKAPNKTKESKETKEPTVVTKEPAKEPKNPKSNQVPIYREIHIEEVPVSTTTVPNTSVGVGNRQPPVLV